jgi:hypothetical protein
MKPTARDRRRVLRRPARRQPADRLALCLLLSLLLNALLIGQIAAGTYGPAPAAATSTAPTTPNTGA